jgi:hypothetical protein
MFSNILFGVNELHHATVCAFETLSKSNMCLITGYNLGHAAFAPVFFMTLCLIGSSFPYSPLHFSLDLIAGL